MLLIGMKNEMGVIKMKIKYYLVIHNQELDEIEVYKAKSEEEVKGYLIKELMKEFRVSNKTAINWIKYEFTIEETNLIEVKS
jgi:hypothetical protein